jgi:hypothetical protein
LGSPYDEAKYQSAIAACALVPDLNVFFVFLLMKFLFDVMGTGLKIQKREVHKNNNNKKGNFTIIVAKERVVSLLPV